MQKILEILLSRVFFSIYLATLKITIIIKQHSLINEKEVIYIKLIQNYQS